MFNQMKLDLNHDYAITVSKNAIGFEIVLREHQDEKGRAIIVTDYVDVECIVSVSVNDDCVNKVIDQKHTLGEMFLKFLIKFPVMVRKPEFRLIHNPPANIQSLLLKNNFHYGNEDKQSMMTCHKIIFPDVKINEKMIFQNVVHPEDVNDILLLLKKNAYWQKNLTLERLNLLISHSRCYLVRNTSNQLIGFARVLSDHASFASLWDVVIDEKSRGKGIGCALMTWVFSDESLPKLASWVLFTESADKLYEKFGFTSQLENPDNKIAYKLRIQDQCPDYMEELIRLASENASIHLNPEQSHEFLFGDSGKRNQGPSFWKQILRLDEEKRVDIIHDPIQKLL